MRALELILLMIWLGLWKGEMFALRAFLVETLALLVG